MKSFSRSGLLLIGLLGAVIGNQLWRRRKLNSLAGRIEYEGRLLQTAIRITHEVRGKVDIQQMLEATAKEIAQALNLTHCLLHIHDENEQSMLAACACQTNHDFGSQIANALNEAEIALCRERIERFVVHDQYNFGSKEPKRMPVLGVPIIFSEEVPIGSVIVSCDSDRVWLENEVQLLLAVSHQLSVSVSQARLFLSQERQALTDSLTGCLNRRAFDLKLPAELQEAKTGGRPLTLIMLDLDNFKRLNDTHGHATGDKALEATAKILLEEVKDSTIAARYGGEEFALILSNCPLKAATKVAERVRQRVEQIRLSDLRIRITASLGLASFPLHALSAEDLVVIADAALYQAKDSGRNRVCAPE
jgi:diguanylate cyclase (GGDEF)-like protein